MSWSGYMSMSGDLGFLSLAKKHNFGKLPDYYPFHIRVYEVGYCSGMTDGSGIEDPETWMGSPVIQMALESPALWWTKNEMGTSSSDGYCPMRGCDFIPRGYPARALCLHAFIHHFELLKVSSSPTNPMPNFG